jgi:hypothetical protein
MGICAHGWRAAGLRSPNSPEFGRAGKHAGRSLATSATRLPACSSFPGSSLGTHCSRGSSLARVRARRSLGEVGSQAEPGNQVAATRHPIGPAWKLTVLSVLTRRSKNRRKVFGEQEMNRQGPRKNAPGRPHRGGSIRRPYFGGWKPPLRWSAGPSNRRSSEAQHERGPFAIGLSRQGLTAAAAAKKV